MDRVVVLGHSGYIGSRLAAALTAGGAQVVGCSAADLDLTGSAAARALEGLLDPDDIVIVLAAIKKQLGDTADVLAENLAIAMNVGRALSAKPVRRIVFFSSAAVYGEDVQHGTITEETPVQPTSFYGIGKFTAERIFGKMADRSPLLVLRPALIYGPAEPDYYYGPSGFLRRAQQKSPITLWGDGSERREFLFVNDVVEIARRVAFGDTTGVLNVVAGLSYTYQDALNEVATIVGERLAVTSRPRTKEKVDHAFDNSALCRACPGLVFATLGEGLRRTAAAQPVGAATQS